MVFIRSREVLMVMAIDKFDPTNFSFSNENMSTSSLISYLMKDKITVNIASVIFRLVNILITITKMGFCLVKTSVHSKDCLLSSQFLREILSY